MQYSRLILLVGLLSAPAVILAQATQFNFGGTYHAGAYSNAVAVADLNGDGNPDIVIASYDTKNVTILLGNGAGTFSEPDGSPFAGGDRPTSVSLGDFNGDGHLDIVVTDQGESFPFGANLFQTKGAARLFLGKGDGQFTAASGNPFPLPELAAIASAARDMNGDGKLDLVVATTFGVSVLIGDGAGGFILPVRDALRGSGVNAMTVVDFNGDGNLDVAFTDLQSGYLGLGDGHGAFLSPQQVTLVSTNTTGLPTGIASGDFNGDGIPDLVISSKDFKAVNVWLTRPNGPFSLPFGVRFFVFPTPPTAVVTGDFNGDGKLDWSAVLPGSNRVAVMLNDGIGGFNPAAGSPYAVGTNPSSIAVGDFNGDGKLDLVTGNQTDVTVLLNSAQRPVQFTLKNSASFASSASFSPGTIMYGEAPNITSFLAEGGTPWPASLGGASVSITDSLGQSQAAPLYYVTPSVVSFLMPAGLATGRATAKVTTTTGVGIVGPVDIGKISPGIFTANANGSGVAAGLWIRVAANGTQTWGYLFDPGQPLGQRKSVFVDLGVADDKVFLFLYGTGFHNATTATATIDDISVPVTGFSVLGDTPGADVISLGPLPRSLLGYSTESPVAILFDKQSANTITVAIH